jgi:hypothetical protein
MAKRNTLPVQTLPRAVPLPPPMQADYVRLSYPGREGPLHVVAVGQAVQGFLTHWYENRAVPCRAPEAPCWLCDGGFQPRWNGYLNVIALPTRRRRILCITEGAFRHSRSLLENDGKLRGLAIKAERMGDKKNAPVRITVGQARDNVVLPADWDILGSLCRIWGLVPSFFHSRTQPQPKEPDQVACPFPGPDERGAGDGRP